MKFSQFGKILSAMFSNNKFNYIIKSKGAVKKLAFFTAPLLKYSKFNTINSFCFRKIHHILME